MTLGSTKGMLKTPFLAVSKTVTQYNLLPLHQLNIKLKQLYYVEFFQ